MIVIFTTDHTNTLNNLIIEYMYFRRFMHYYFKEIIVL